MCHPATPTSVVRRIDVGVGMQHDGALRLRYFLDGEIDRIALPPRGIGRRAERLWQHTCFEAFVARSDARAYCELNFSPSRSGPHSDSRAYREGMSPIALQRDPAIAVSVVRGPARARGVVGPEILLALPGMSSLKLGLSAVIEETDGRLSYWALVHPAERPDFHHRDGFVLPLEHPDEDGAFAPGRPGDMIRFRHRPAARRARAAQAACGPTRRAARASRLGHRATSTHSLDALAALADLRLTAAFGPQHGLRGDKQDNMVESPDYRRSRCTASPCSACTARCAGPTRGDDGRRSTCCWSTCRTSAAASTPSSRRCATCSRRRRGTARAVWVLDRPESGRSAGRGPAACARAGRASSARARCRCGTA